MLSSMSPFWRIICFLLWKILEFLKRALFFNKIMTPSIPLKGPRSGWNLKVSRFLIGQHNLQTLILLNIWQILKKKLNSYATPPRGVWELWKRIDVERVKIEVEECQILIERMPRRLEAVIKAKKGHAKY
jgi:hypothetical protein